MEPEFEPRQPGFRVSTLNPDEKGIVESNGNVKAEKKN